MSVSIHSDLINKLVSDHLSITKMSKTIFTILLVLTNLRDYFNLYPQSHGW